MKIVKKNGKKVLVGSKKTLGKFAGKKINMKTAMNIMKESQLDLLQHYDMSVFYNDLVKKEIPKEYTISIANALLNSRLPFDRTAIDLTTLSDYLRQAWVNIFEKDDFMGDGTSAVFSIWDNLSFLFNNKWFKENILESSPYRKRLKKSILRQLLHNPILFPKLNYPIFESFKDDPDIKKTLIRKIEDSERSEVQFLVDMWKNIYPEVESITAILSQEESRYDETLDLDDYFDKGDYYPTGEYEGDYPGEGF